MPKFAVVGDGTGAHEHFVITVTANDETDALNKVAAHIIGIEEDCAVEQGKVDNHCSPTYECSLYNDEGDTVYELKTSPLQEL